MRKKILALFFLLFALGNLLCAQARLAEPSDPNAQAGPGQAEIIIDTANTDKNIAVWMNGVIVAHVLPKTREKIIVANGTYQVEAADTTLSRGNWSISSKKQISVVANSNSTTIGMTTRYGTLLNLTVQSTAALSPAAPTGGQPARSSASAAIPSGDGSQAYSLENAVYRAAQEIINNVPPCSILAVLSIATNDPDVAEFVIEELAFHMVAARKFRVVDRKSLDVVRAEHSFQISGDVDDNSAISIGKMLGASIVVTGSVSGSGSTRRLRAKALDVQTAEIVAMASERY